jgi:hypothetical protein
MQSVLTRLSSPRGEQHRVVRNMTTLASALMQAAAVDQGHVHRVVAVLDSADRVYRCHYDLGRAGECDRAAEYCGKYCGKSLLRNNTKDR